MDKYLRKVSGLVATLNRIEKDLMKRSGDPHMNFTQFGFGWYNVSVENHVIGTQAAYFYSDLQHFPHLLTDEQQFQYPTPAWGGIKPTHVYLFDEYIRSETEIQHIVKFLRKAISNGGLEGMKFGTIEVVSKMTDYLDVIEEK